MSTNSFQLNTKRNINEWITDPTVPDPENLPEPLGWTILVRPYPIKNTSKGGIILDSTTTDFANYMTNIGRVVKIAPCCWNRAEHAIDGVKQPWVEVGDFVEYAANTGLKRKFKGVSYMVLMDDELISRLPDPCVYAEQTMSIDIPQDQLEKYNTVYNKEYMKAKNNV